MTFAGKILVLLNLIMSFIFMAFAVMVYQSRIDMKGKLDAANQQVAVEKKKTADMETDKQNLEKQLQDKNADLQKSESENARRLGEQKTQIEQLRSSVARSRDEAASALAASQVANTELTQRKQEVDRLREYRDKLLTDNRNLVNERTKLTDQLAQSNNQLSLASTRNNQLVEQLERWTTYVRRVKGSLPAEEELEQMEGPGAPTPDVEGIVTRVDQANKFVELSIGADDGIKNNNVLEIWRTKPEPKYLGKLKVVMTENTKSVAKPISVSGPIQVNDRVGARIMPGTRSAN